MLIICWYFVPVTGQPQIEVKASVDTTSYVFGDQIRLYLEVSPVGPNTQLADAIGLLDSLDDGTNPNRLGNIELIERMDWSKNQQIGSTEIILGAFDTGYQFFVCPILYTDNGITDTLLSNEAFFYIAPVITDSTGIAPIKDILTEPLTIQDFLPYLIGIGGLAILGVLIWLWLRKRRRVKQDQPPPLIFIPPHEIAINKLKELKEASLWQQGEIKLYQSRLTYIIREYIEKAMLVPALEMTSGEIIHQLRNKSIGENQLTDLSKMLNIADLVKFAKGEPNVNIHVELMEKAEQFIYDTYRIHKAEEE